MRTGSAAAFGGKDSLVISEEARARLTAMTEEKRMAAAENKGVAIAVPVKETSQGDPKALRDEILKN